MWVLAFCRFLKQAPEIAELSTPLPGWKIKEAYLFATTRVADGSSQTSGSPPWYETVVVDTSGLAKQQARSMAEHRTQTGDKDWQELMPRFEGRAAVLGAATRPPLAAAEWFTRVMNMG